MIRFRFLTLCILLAAVGAIVCPARAAVAAPPAEANADDANTATEAAKKALNGRTRFPWYDAAKDDLRRIDVTAQRDDKNDNRNSQWETKSAPANTGPVTSSDFLRALGEVVRVLIYLIIAALIVTAIVLLVRAFLRRETQVLINTGEKSEEDAKAEISRVENLPFQVPTPKGDMLSEAERQYQAGNYDLAIIYLFSYELMRLDKAQVIRLTKGKTNRQYVREARSRPELAAILKNTMLAFEDVFFGHHSLERERFEECWREVETFQRLTGQPAEVAA